MFPLHTGQKELLAPLASNKNPHPSPNTSHVDICPGLCARLSSWEFWKLTSALVSDPKTKMEKRPQEFHSSITLRKYSKKKISSAN